MCSNRGEEKERRKKSNRQNFPKLGFSLELGATYADDFSSLEEKAQTCITCLLQALLTA